MESVRSRVDVPNSRQSSKRLLFDRRYGWVIDDWKDPSEEALDGGRGMFSVVPLATRLVKMVSQLIKHVATSAIKASEKPQFSSRQMLHSALDDYVRNFMSSLKKTVRKGLILDDNSQPHASSRASHSRTECNE